MAFSMLIRLFACFFVILVANRCSLAYRPYNYNVYHRNPDRRPHARTWFQMSIPPLNSLPIFPPGLDPDRIINHFLNPGNWNPMEPFRPIFETRIDSYPVPHHSPSSPPPSPPNSFNLQPSPPPQSDVGFSLSVGAGRWKPFQSWAPTPSYVNEFEGCSHGFGSKSGRKCPRPGQRFWEHKKPPMRPARPEFGFGWPYISQDEQPLSPGFFEHSSKDDCNRKGSKPFATFTPSFTNIGGGRKKVTVSPVTESIPAQNNSQSPTVLETGEKTKPENLQPENLQPENLQPENVQPESATEKPIRDKVGPPMYLPDENGEASGDDRKVNDDSKPFPLPSSTTMANIPMSSDEPATAFPSLETSSESPSSAAAETTSTSSASSVSLASSASPEASGASEASSSNDAESSSSASSPGSSSTEANSRDKELNEEDEEEPKESPKRTDMNGEDISGPLDVTTTTESSVKERNNNGDGKSDEDEDEKASGDDLAGEESGRFPVKLPASPSSFSFSSPSPYPYPYPSTTRFPELLLVTDNHSGSSGTASPSFFSLESDTFPEERPKKSDSVGKKEQRELSREELLKHIASLDEMEIRKLTEKLGIKIAT